MIFVVEAVYEEELRLYAKLFTEFRNPRDLTIGYPETIWKVLSRPSGVAVLEILQGSRSDKVLAEQPKPIQTRIERNALDRGQRVTGIIQSSLALMRLMVWSARGLSIAQFLVPDPAELDQTVALLSKLIASGLETGALVIEGNKPPPIDDQRKLRS